MTSVQSEAIVTAAGIIAAIAWAWSLRVAHRRGRESASADLKRCVRTQRACITTLEGEIAALRRAILPRAPQTLWRGKELPN